MEEIVSGFGTASLLLALLYLGLSVVERSNSKIESKRLRPDVKVIADAQHNAKIAAYATSVYGLYYVGSLGTTIYLRKKKEG